MEGLGRKVEDTIHIVKNLLARLSEFGKRVSSDVPLAGLIINIIMTIIVFIALCLVWWWSKQMILLIVESFGSSFGRMKSEMRDWIRNRNSRSLPTISGSIANAGDPLIRSASGVVNNNYNPLLVSKPVLKSPLVLKKPQIQSRSEQVMTAGAQPNEVVIDNFEVYERMGDTPTVPARSAPAVPSRPVRDRPGVEDEEYPDDIGDLTPKNSPRSLRSGTMRKNV